MTAANLAPNLDETDLELLNADLRSGHSCIATFACSRGLAWMEILGPKGMRPAGDLFVAPVRTLRLWVPGDGAGPLAVAAANDDFGAGLRAIEQQARSHLGSQEFAGLATVLRVVRASTTRSRRRLPTIGDELTETGSPSLRGWASCLTLGDLEAALRRACLRDSGSNAA
jgi:hypothetical protein